MSRSGEPDRSGQVLVLAERIGAQLPTIAGVEAAKSLSYDLIQFLNRITKNERTFENSR